jgi:uncharacterized membrane protein YdjX (TVP38/TMEM64 family)
MLLSTITNWLGRQPHRSTSPNRSTRNGFKLVKFALSISIVIGITFILMPAAAWGQTSAQTAPGFNPQIWLKNALQWIESLGSVGAWAFIGLYILATVAFLPGSILTLGAGVVFGVVMGSLYVGRYVARGWVAQKIAGDRKFQAIDEAVGKGGFKIVLLTRLSPIFPFNLLNYAYGVTGVSLKDYVLASIGMIPGTIMYVYIGSLAGSLATIGTDAQPGNPTIQWAMRIIGSIATIAVTIYVTKVARKALEDEVSF